MLIGFKFESVFVRKYVADDLRFCNFGSFWPNGIKKNKNDQKEADRKCASCGAICERKWKRLLRIMGVHVVPGDENFHKQKIAEVIIWVFWMSFCNMDWVNGRLKSEPARKYGNYASYCRRLWLWWKVWFCFIVDRF